jgi:hypothetical protein
VIAASSDSTYSKDIFDDVYQAIEQAIPKTIGIDGRMKNCIVISARQSLSLVTCLVECGRMEADILAVQLADADARHTDKTDIPSGTLAQRAGNRAADGERTRGVLVLPDLPVPALPWDSVFQRQCRLRDQMLALPLPLDTSSPEHEAALFSNSLAKSLALDPTFDGPRPLYSAPYSHYALVFNQHRDDHGRWSDPDETRRRILKEMELNYDLALEDPLAFRGPAENLGEMSPPQYESLTPEAVNKLLEISPQYMSLTFAAVNKLLEQVQLARAGRNDRAEDEGTLFNA